MQEITLPKLPGKHFKGIQKKLENEFKIFTSHDFISNKTNTNIGLFLYIVNLVSLDDFQNKLLSRNQGVLEFETGKENDFVKFTNQSRTSTFQKIEKPLPYIGRLKIKIDVSLYVVFRKISESGFIIEFNNAIEVNFSNPNINREVRKQNLKTIEITENSFKYHFENTKEGKPNLNIYIDLNLVAEDSLIKKQSEESLGKLNKSICTDICFIVDDDDSGCKKCNCKGFRSDGDEPPRCLNQNGYNGPRCGHLEKDHN